MFWKMVHATQWAFSVGKKRNCRKVVNKMSLAWYYCWYCYIIKWKPIVDICMFSFSGHTSWEGCDVGFASRWRYNPLCRTPGDVVIHLSSFNRQTKLVKAPQVVCSRPSVKYLLLLSSHSDPLTRQPLEGWLNVQTGVERNQPQPHIFILFCCCTWLVQQKSNRIRFNSIYLKWLPCPFKIAWA